MRYAEVSVNSPVAQRRTFSYSIPLDMDVREGQAVLVPFGQRELQGIVLELTPLPAVEDTREIIDVLESEPVISHHQITLARWISEYYLSPLFDAVALMLPPGFERKAVTFLSIISQVTDTASLNDDQVTAIKLIQGQERFPLSKLEKVLGKKKASSVVSQLIRQGIITRNYELGPVKIKPRKVLYIKLAGAGDSSKLSAKQSVLFNYLKEQAAAVPWAEVRKKTGCTRAVANALAEKGLAIFEEIEVRREPISYENITLSNPLTLTPGQQTAFDAIKASLQTETKVTDSPDVFLLHGVTGSGKTEIYLQALAETVKLGKKGIVLVPEIALTPQTIERFASRFPHRVAVLHSRLTLGERFDEWHRIKKGEFDVVIGSRSAIFAPQPDLGLIVIDEEHEWTYKQDTSPHYHARAAAIKLAELTGAVVVMGSATPDVETFYKAQNREYRLLTLPERVVPTPGAALPQVEIVDMREELKAGNRSMFSRALSEAINEAVNSREQVILFLNRRGGATSVQCRSCGFVLRCRRCEVPLSYHIDEDVLTCHQCNYKTPNPKACPRCSSKQIRYLGTGTQKLEQEVKYTFPRARHLRWDSDVIGGRTSHQDILKQFKSREAEILIGTQMVAKGLDIPSVTLVGVVIADTSLNLPDFRAGERTFQLMSQVAGRAGRGASGGRVIIQTFSPEHYAIQAAARHDYASFYKQELEFRKQLHNPPFTRLARLVYTHTNDAACRREAERVKTMLIEESNARGIGNIVIIGPAPAFIHRRRGRYRWQLILRGDGLSEFLSPVAFPQSWSIDVDPVSLIQ